jgi:hypothetical protein
MIFGPLLRCAMFNYSAAAASGNAAWSASMAPLQGRRAQRLRKTCIKIRKS